MADLARKVTVERGLDPRHFVLYAYGGAGPVFAAFLTQHLGAEKAYVPADSGVFSAFGMLTTDIMFQEERSTNLRTPLPDDAPDAINALYADLAKRVIARFDATALDSKRVKLTRAVDMRFGMQVHELEVDVPDGKLTLADIEKVTKDFVAKYEQTYGRDSAYTAAGIEYVNFRVSGTLDMERPNLDVKGHATNGAGSITGRKKAFFAPAGEVDTDIHAGDKLRPGQSIKGPAIIQRSGDTVVLPPGTLAEVDRFGGITITWQEKAR
jgi:N-methylhydantoinase A